VNRPRTGDKYKWLTLAIEIREVSPDGRWAMIHITWPERDHGALGITPSWESDKQQPTPDGKLPDDWELIEAANGPEPAQEPTAPVGALRVWDGDWPAPAPCYTSGLGFMIHGPGCEHPA
jgi:hypothetical protein